RHPGTLRPAPRTGRGRCAGERVLPGARRYRFEGSCEGPATGLTAGLFVGLEQLSRLPGCTRIDHGRPVTRHPAAGLLRPFVRVEVRTRTFDFDGAGSERRVDLRHRPPAGDDGAGEAPLREVGRFEAARLNDWQRVECAGRRDHGATGIGEPFAALFVARTDVFGVVVAGEHEAADAWNGLHDLGRAQEATG